MTIANMYGYQLNQKHFSVEKCSEIIWGESALYKKHKPSELSFDSLMTTLKSPINQENLIK